MRNQRAYDTTHTEDIVTIGTLKVSTDVVHTSGNESISGVKTIQKVFAQEVEIPYRFRRGKSWYYSNSKGYKRLFRYTTNAGVIIRLNIMWGFNTPSRWGIGDAIISDCGICKVDYKGTSSFGPGGIYLCKGVDGYTYLIATNVSGYNGVTVEMSNSTRYSQNDDIPGFEILNESSFTDPPVVGETYTAVYQGEAL